MTKGLLVSRREKLRLRKLSLEFPTLTNKNRYNKYRQMYNTLIKARKKLYYSDLLHANKSNPKKTWQILNSFCGKNSIKSEITTIKNGDTLITDKKEIAQSFNLHFATIAEKVVSSIPKSNVSHKSYLPTQSSYIFSLPTIVSDTILEMLNLLESKSSQDGCGMSIKFLKNIAYEIAYPLSLIFNLIFTTGKIPKQFKSSRTVPIFKSGDPQDVNNYRPIGLINVFSKIMEKIVCKYLSSFLEENDLLYKHQYGFRRRHSTIHPIIHFLNKVAMSSNLNEFTLAIFCDLQKCFDVLNRDILLDKLSNIGVRDMALEWFKNYFDDRIFFTDIDGEFSDSVETTLGVVQGSILGPLLATIYLNDMYLACADSQLLLFADDSSLIFSNQNINNLLNIANIGFKNLCQWMRANKLKLHPSKTKFMIFCNNRKSIPTPLPPLFMIDTDDSSTQVSELQIECLNFSTEPYIRFLGITVDPHLTFKYHIRKISAKISQGLYILRKVQNILPEVALRMMYFSLINSHLYYGLSAYSCTSKTQLKPLVILQKKAIRIISKSRYNAHTDPIFKRLRILKFDDLVKFSIYDFMHSFSNDMLPTSFHDIWAVKTTLNLRNFLDFNVPFTRLEFSKRLPYHRFPDMWNNMGGCEEYKFEADKKRFHRGIKNYFFYCLPEVVSCHNQFCGYCNLSHIV